MITDFKFPDMFCERCGVQLARYCFSEYCNKCVNDVKDELAKEKEQKHFDDLKQKTIEERIVILEEFMYNHLKNHPKKELLFR